jgi:acyl-CoA synthetase (AMP-forming)/AMP-acid ligase II
MGGAIEFVKNPQTDTPLVGDFESFGEAFVAAAAMFFDVEAYVQGERRMTYRDWFAAADALAANLVNLGVKPGDVVLIALESSIDFAVCYAAVLLAGGITSGVNVRLGPREMDAIVERSQARLIILEDSASLPANPPAVVRRSRLAGLCQGEGLGERRPSRESSDPAVIIWTSGTTGSPKGAWFDHAGIRAAVSLSGEMSAPFERKFMPTPFAHAGFMAKMWEQIAFAITIVIPPAPWTALEMLRLMVRERINVAAGVPTQWDKLMALPAVDVGDFSSIRVCVTATAPVPPDLTRAVTTRIGRPLIVRYATTESPSITGTRAGDPPDILYHTVGRPQRGVEVQIVDESGVPCAQGEVGRIRLRSPGMMRGYWRDPERTAEAFGEGGWLNTGDLGRVDERGNISLAGRIGEMYIRGGYNVYPIEVERRLREHEDIDDAAVVGCAAPVIGEIGVAFIVLKAGAPGLSLETVRLWVRKALADYKAPDQLYVLDALPRTVMMKVDKPALGRLVKHNEGGAVK